MVGITLLRGKMAAFGIPGSARKDAGSDVAPPSASEQAFRDAERHSARVRMLRKAIPMGCAAAIALVIVVRFLNPFRAVVPDVSVSTVGLQGSKLTMEQPKVSGFKKDNTAYDVVADSAVQDLKKPNLVELIKPVARIEMQKGSWANMSAATGVYDSAKEFLTVDTDVRFSTDTGMALKLKSAEIDLKKGTLLSNHPVDLTLPNGWVKSDRLQILDNGKSAIFEGNVKSEFVNTEPAPATQASPQ
ncbi:MAG: LPS export ABC transporter periplasmic protein LptC [Proteobacteria bacterium]|nr:LPS export ABC transporter periplasmic protein LptC [Pseudomonadota bacterium]